MARFVRAGVLCAAAVVSWGSQARAQSPAWTTHQGSEFLLPDAQNRLPYDEAVAHCDRQGAHLVYLQSVDDYAYMAQVLVETDVNAAWIGARRSATADPDNQFRWVGPVRAPQWMLRFSDRTGDSGLWTKQKIKKKQHCLQMGGTQGKPQQSNPHPAAAIRGSLCDEVQPFACRRPGKLPELNCLFASQHAPPATPHRCAYLPDCLPAYTATRVGAGGDLAGWRSVACHG